MITSHTTTTVLLGLTAAASLLLCSTTTTALPASIRYDSLLTPNNNKDTSKDNYSPSDKSQQWHHDSILFSVQVTRPTTAKEPLLPPPPPSSTIFSPSNHNNKNNNQLHDLQVSSFSESTPRWLQHDSQYPSPYYYSAHSREQILHHCTAHFLALLDAEISDRLVAQLSRLVMMLPVIGVETRAVMRTKVLQVMGQIVSTSGLTQYNTLRRVIQTAVDDASLLESPSEMSKRRNAAGSNNFGRQCSKGPGPRRQHPSFLSDDVEQDDLSPIGGAVEGSEDIDGSTNGDDVDSIGGGSLEDDASEDSIWLRLPSSLKRDSGSSSRTDRISSNMNDLTSQIPVVTEVALEAVLDYMAEILTPTLVIRQLTEAIKEALQQSSRELSRSGMIDLNDQELNINALSNQNTARDQHGLDLLSDDWIWSSSSSTLGSSRFEEDEEADSSQNRGQDEDLWDQDMELHPWDTTARLFEDFEDYSDIGLNNESQKTTTTSPDWNAVTTGGSDEEEGDEYPDPFTIGIQDPEDAREQNDDDDDDEDIESFSDYARQTYLGRFQKRSIDLDRTDTVATEVKEGQEENTEPSVALNEEESRASSEAAFDKRSRSSDSAFLSRRRPDFAPDPRLESLLTQLIEPMLTTFIDEDFPASCKRVQGELMDGIIWSLDQTEFSSQQESNDLDQLALLAELEY